MRMAGRIRGLGEGFASDAPAFEPGRPPVDLVEPQATQENARWVGWRDQAVVTNVAGELGGAFGPHRLIRVWAGRGATQNTALLRAWLQAEPGASFPGAGNILAAGAFHIAP